MSAVQTIEGLEGRKMRRRRMGLRDFDDFDDFGDSELGDMLGAIVSPEQLKGLLLSGLAGGGGILATSWLLGKVSVAPVWKGVIETLAGLVGGRLLWNLDDDAAKGFSGGVAGLGIASIIKALAPSIPVGLGYDPRYGWGVGQPGTRYMDWGVGMGRTRVTDFPAGSPQLGRTRVEERQPNEFMLGRLGQDVTVGTWLT